MKGRVLIRWVVTGLMASLMVLSAVPDIVRLPAALSVFNHLGYPTYLLRFLGTAKVLGVAAVLTPRLRTVKEWAFAGLTFDLVGAMYSHVSVGDPLRAWLPAAIGLGLMIGSYIAYRSAPTSRDDRVHDSDKRAVGTRAVA
jgi:hypothetical protein